jgi:hypothetical protein
MKATLNTRLHNETSRDADTKRRDDARRRRRGGVGAGFAPSRVVGANYAHERGYFDAAMMTARAATARACVVTDERHP